MPQQCEVELKRSLAAGGQELSPQDYVLENLQISQTVISIKQAK